MLDRNVIPICKSAQKTRKRIREIILPLWHVLQRKKNLLSHIFLSQFHKRIGFKQISLVLVLFQ